MSSTRRHTLLQRGIWVSFLEEVVSGLMSHSVIGAIGTFLASNDH